MERPPGHGGPARARCGSWLPPPEPREHHHRSLPIFAEPALYLVERAAAPLEPVYTFPDIADLKHQMRCVNAGIGPVIFPLAVEVLHLVAFPRGFLQPEVAGRRVGPADRLRLSRESRRRYR